MTSPETSHRLYLWLLSTSWMIAIEIVRRLLEPITDVTTRLAREEWRPMQPASGSWHDHDARVGHTHHDESRLVNEGTGLRLEGAGSHEPPPSRQASPHS
ncbi:hypothetical protein DL93DRAFT_2085126 [Clavulina sp. PMI_390]|nr:hypothetical protein DL93DRAFT_2085126 [Clavulina sp. PMI_390]